MKNEYKNINLDEMLDELKNVPMPEFPSADVFKEDFFRRTETLPPAHSAHLYRKIFLTMTSAAAAVAVALFLHLQYAEEEPVPLTDSAVIPLMEVDGNASALASAEKERRKESISAEPIPAAVKMVSRDKDMEISNNLSIKAVEKEIAASDLLPQSPPSLPESVGANVMQYIDMNVSSVVPAVPMSGARADMLETADTGLTDKEFAEEKPRNNADLRGRGYPMEGVLTKKLKKNNIRAKGGVFRRISDFNTEEYKGVAEKPFITVMESPLSTFGADVDTASYTMLRRMLLQDHRRPPAESIRTEELLNYFKYDYAVSKDKDFNVRFESMTAPWAKDHRLLLVGVQAKTVDVKELPPANLVFLVDSSGSMWAELPTVKDAMTALAEQLRENDRISLVTYGGGVNVLADGLPGAQRGQIIDTVQGLCCGGYTPGAKGIQTAYELARKHFIKGGNNRIVLITDGDFNMGVSSEADLIALVEKERQSAVYLSVFGVGEGNYKDNKLKMIANRGNGNYAYLDCGDISEARNVMVNEMSGKMFTLGKDVKFQIEFNPAKVTAYRLIGYEMRALAARDFNDDAKDAGGVGLGHQVTALYELVMADAPAAVREKHIQSTDALTYQEPARIKESGNILTFKLRCQKPEGKDPSRLLTFDLKSMPEATDNIRWAAAVAEFSLILRNSPYKGNADLNTLRSRSAEAIGKDSDGKRKEFLTMIEQAEKLFRAEK